MSLTCTAMSRRWRGSAAGRWPSSWWWLGWSWSRWWCGSVLCLVSVGSSYWPSTNPYSSSLSLWGLDCSCWRSATSNSSGDTWGDKFSLAQTQTHTQSEKNKNPQTFHLSVRYICWRLNFHTFYAVLLKDGQVSLVRLRAIWMTNNPPASTLFFGFT